LKKPLTEERRERFRQVGLHYCKHYENVVRYNAPACGKCRHATYQKR
jgi:hypothetical protein